MLVETKEYEAPDPGVPGPSIGIEEREAPKEELKTPPIESSLVKTIEALNNKVESSTRSAALLADPMYREYLNLKAAGKKVRITEEKPEPQQGLQLPELPKDLENLTNAQLLEHMTKLTIAAAENAAQRASEKHLGTLRSELEPQLQGIVQSQELKDREDAARQIDGVKKKYKDFETMKPQMAEIAKVSAGLSVEELYMLSKIRAGLPLVEKEMETERPVEAPSGRQTRTLKVGAPTRGRAGFQAILNAELSRRETVS